MNTRKCVIDGLSDLPKITQLQEEESGFEPRNYSSSLSIKTGHSILRFGLTYSQIQGVHDGRVTKRHLGVVERDEDFGAKRLRFESWLCNFWLYV